MEENQGSKTEAPTPKKLKDARDEGNVAKSRDLSMFFAILSVLSWILIGHKLILGEITEFYSILFNLIKDNSLDYNSILKVIYLSFGLLFKIIIPIVLLGGISAGLLTVIQIGGFIFSPKVFKFDFQKFNIVNNFKQIFGKKSLIKFLFNIIKILIMLIVSYNLLINSLSTLLHAINLPFIDMMLLIFRIVFKIIMILLSIFFVFSLADFILEKRAIYKQLMMSLEEIKKEYKETDGNPEIKYRRRELHRELLESDDDMFGVHKDFMMVLANPTHIGVVIIYQPSKWKLPITLYKSKGYSAQVLFKVAKKYDVPVIREKSTARNLYAFAELNQFIPKSLIKDVAYIIGNNLHLRPKISEDIEIVKKGIKQNIIEGPESIKVNFNNKN
jgi:flagellar biosynthesis protein FlhB